MDRLRIRRIQIFVDECRADVEQGRVDYKTEIQQSVNALTRGFNKQTSSLDELLQYWKDEGVELLDLIGCSSRYAIGSRMRTLFNNINPSGNIASDTGPD